MGASARSHHVSNRFSGHVKLSLYLNLQVCDLLPPLNCCFSSFSHVCKKGLWFEFFFFTWFFSVDIRTFEVLVRTYEVRQEFLQTTLQCSTQFASDCLLKPPPQKRQRPQKGRSQQTEQADGEEPQKDEIINGNNSLSETAGNGLKLQENIDGDRLAVTKKAERETRPVIAKPYPDTKGHTGYLTFARRST
jgi:hypothetical protein